MNTQEYYGWHGKVLRVNLSDKTHRVEELDPEDLRLLLGGRGLGAAMLMRETPAHNDPLGPDNPLIFSTGPLVGTKVPGSNRYCLHTKSPLTGLYCFSISGGKFGDEMKKTGYDVIIITGKADEPVYLYVDDQGKVEFKNAEHLWGLDTERTQEFIRTETSPAAGISCIGPAGEKLVPYACLINERRALGRGGAGAVMGSKNLKAIMVRGNKKTEVADPEALKEAIKASAKEIKDNPMTAKVLRMYGSSAMVADVMNNGILPSNNWQGVALEEAQSVTADKMREHYLVKDVACSSSCPVKCSKMFGVKDGDWAGAFSEGPDYETVYAFGPCCGIFDLGAVIQADQICDQLGLDTISAGVSISFAMECLERGIISAEEYETGDLKFGAAAAMINLLKDIGYQRGFGKVVGLGSKTMSERFGQDSAEFAMHAKGMELGGYDPRGAKGMSLVFACGPRGGCHHAGGYTVIPELKNPQIDRFAEEGRAGLVAITRNKRAAICDSGLTCAFVAIAFSDETGAALLSAATGIDFAPGDIIAMGDRISCLERAYNYREGLTRDQDTLPKRLVKEAIGRGPSEGHLVQDLEAMKDEFYKISGWDIETGAPLPDRLIQLEIGWVRELMVKGAGSSK